MTDEPNTPPTIKLAEGSAFTLHALANGGLDVTIRVPMADMESGWRQLTKIMDADPSFDREQWYERGHTEEELRLLCGVFFAVSYKIPMCTSNFIEWLRVYEAGSGAVDDFVMWRVKQLDNESLRYALMDRDLSALASEKLDKPAKPNKVSWRDRGPGRTKKAA